LIILSDSHYSIPIYHQSTMNALVSQDSLNIGTESAFHSYVVSILINTFLIVIVLDYIVHRVQTINLFEKRISENHEPHERAFSKFKEETKNYEKSLEEYKVSNSKLLDGLCRGIDEKLLDINFQVQDGIDAVEKKLKLLVNSELDKVDNIYDKLTRKFLLLQSNISESCENNSDRMTNLEETLNAHISLLCDKIETMNQYVEDIKKNVFKVISRELDEMKQEYLTLYDESDQKMNEQMNVISVLKEFVKKYLRVYFPAEISPSLNTFDEHGHSLPKKFERQQQQRTGELREFGAKYSIENW